MQINYVNSKGLSLIEMLVVITIFAILGMLVTSSVILTIKGTKKSEAMIRVRENMDYSLGIIERQIRQAKSIPVCPNLDPLRIDYLDQEGAQSFFACNSIGNIGSYIASGSARLTTDNVIITDCSFTCNLGNNNPPVISVSLSIKDALLSGASGFASTTSTQIYLRNY